MMPFLQTRRGDPVSQGSVSVPGKVAFMTMGMVAFGFCRRQLGRDTADPPGVGSDFCRS